MGGRVVVWSRGQLVGISSLATRHPLSGRVVAIPWRGTGETESPFGRECRHLSPALLRPRVSVISHATRHVSHAIRLAHLASLADLAHRGLDNAVQRVGHTAGTKWLQAHT